MSQQGRLAVTASKSFISDSTSLSYHVKARDWTTLASVEGFLNKTSSLKRTWQHKTSRSASFWTEETKVTLQKNKLSININCFNVFWSLTAQAQTGLYNRTMNTSPPTHLQQKKKRSSQSPDLNLTELLSLEQYVNESLQMCKERVKSPSTMMTSSKLLLNLVP